MVLNEIINIFVKTVEELIDYNLPNNGKLYIETKNGEYVNFRPKDFKNKIISVTKEKDINKYLNYFKGLGLIVTTGKHSYSNIQRVKSKTRRVTTVEKNKFLLLKKLLESEKEKTMG